MRTGAVLLVCLAATGLACAQTPPPLPERGKSDAPATEKQILEKLTKMIKQVEAQSPQEKSSPSAKPANVVVPPPVPVQTIPSPAVPPPVLPTPRPIDPPFPPPSPVPPTAEATKPPLPPVKKGAAAPAHVRIRDVLNNPITLNYIAKDVPAALAHLRERTGVLFILDAAARRELNTPAAENPPPVVLKATNVPLRNALNAALTQQRLGYAVVGETVVITTEKAAGSLRLRQLVQIDVGGAPLKTVLQHLSADTGVSVVIDPRLSATKVGNEPITLNVQEVAVHDAVRLLAEFANLKAVQVGNVLVLTSPENAARMNQANPTPTVVGVSGFLPNH